MEIGSDQIEEVLARAMVGRVAVISDGEPYVVPKNFAYKDGHAFMHGADKGRLISAIRQGSPICFEVDEHTGTISASFPCDYDTGYASVIGFGTARVIDDTKEKLEALKLITRKYASNEAANKFDETIVAEYRAHDTGSTIEVIELTLDRITGKANRPQDKH